jgi:hypothetical protein
MRTRKDIPRQGLNLSETQRLRSVNLKPWMNRGESFLEEGMPGRMPGLSNVKLSEVNLNCAQEERHPQGH